jgi:uncharacterized protein with NRDE domain
MCLILFAHDMHSAYRLIVGANRDEFHGRLTAPAAWWKDAPGVLAGRDLQGGGTWMGVTRSGRFAAVTNIRTAGMERVGAPSRGALVADFLRGDDHPEAYLEKVAREARRFNGFNLLVWDEGGLWYLSSHTPEVRQLDPGVCGLSNAPLGIPWPKTERGRRGLQQLLAAPAGPEPEAILGLLADETIPGEQDLPDTGVGREHERILAPAFISGPVYGSRSSTVLLIAHDGEASLVERTFGPGGERVGEVRYDFP